MTDEQLAALRALADAATPGPWDEVAVEGEQWITGPDTYEDAVMRTDDAELSVVDATFIAAARAAVPALLAEVDRLRAFAATQHQAGYDHAIACALEPPHGPPYEVAGLLAELNREKEAHGMCEAHNRQLSWQLEQLTAEVDRLRAELAQAQERLAEISAATKGVPALLDEMGQLHERMRAEIAQLRGDNALLHQLLQRTGVQYTPPRFDAIAGNPPFAE